MEVGRYSATDRLSDPGAGVLLTMGVMSVYIYSYI